MSRNFKPDYLKKLLGIATANGYKIDLANYIHNPATDNEYPALYKTVEATEDHTTRSRVYYMKYWDGTGAYIIEESIFPNTGSTWEIARNRTTRTAEASNRFNLNKLIAIAEAL